MLWAQEENHSKTAGFQFKLKAILSGFLPQVHPIGLPGPKKNRQPICIVYSCKGKCQYVETKVKRQVNNKPGIPYDPDIRFCSGCDSYFKGGSIRCKCCGCKKRTRRLSRKYRNRF